jgi:hypothetical protein
VLQVSEPTLQRDWRMARSYMMREISGAPKSAAGRDDSEAQP